MKKESNEQSKNHLFLMLVICFFSILTTQAQSRKEFNLPKLNKENKLISANKKIKVIRSEGKEGVSTAGVVWLKDVEFSNGIIEIDLRGKDLMQQSFIGIAFHGIDTITYDAIYFRPFNFRSNDSIRRIHAVQYISHPQHGWDILRETFPCKYENAVIPAPQPNDWFHAKIVVKDNNISVFVNDSDIPSLTVEKLNPRKEGLLGLWAYGSEGDFANFSIRKL